MKNLSIAVFFLLTLSFTGSAQIYTVTSNNQSWSSLIPSGTCTSCTINVPAGWTLLLNSSGTCNSCTFNGGTVNITSNFSFTNGTTTFNNDTVLINKASTTFNSVSFNNDSVAVNFSFSVQNGTSAISNSRMQVGANMTFNAAGFTGSSLVFTGSSNMTINNALTFTSTTLTSTAAITLKASSVTLQTGSAMTLAAGSTLKSDNAITLTSSTLTATDATIKGSSFTAQTNSTVTLSGATDLKSDNAINITASNLTTSGSTTMKGSSFTAQTGSNVSMSGTSNLTVDNAINIKASNAKFLSDAWAKAGDAIILDSGSIVTVGDGALAGTAHLTTNNQLQVLNGSQLGIANGNNYLYTSASNYTDGSTSRQIRTNTISCGSGHANSCATGYVYGCATLNSSGALGCVTLALSAPALTARLSNGQVILSWQTTTTDLIDRFVIQRSANGHDWSPIGEIISNPLTAAYSIKDAQTQPGDNYYRLQVVDKDGYIAYSSVNIVNLGSAAGEISLYPNPVKGHTFFLRTPSTDAIIVKAYTPGGQLLLIAPLKGQTQYTVQLPSSLTANSYVLVQVIGNGRTQTFTVLEQ